MKAILQERFGPPDVLRLADVDVPEPGSDDVLVAVRAAALNPYDWHMLRGDPLVARLFGGMGLTRPKSLVAGLDAAGRVEAVGRNVTGLRPGDEILAAASGAEVTGVCGTANVDLVASLGASSVVDHTSADFTDTDDPYDVILDNVGNRPLRQLRGALAQSGTLVVNAGGSPGHVFGAVGSTLRAVTVNCVVRQRLTPLPDRRGRSFLLAVTDAVEKGTLSPVLDRRYPLADVAEGLRHVERGHARGKVVVTVA